MCVCVCVCVCVLWELNYITFGKRDCIFFIQKMFLASKKLHVIIYLCLAQE